MRQRAKRKAWERTHRETSEILGVDQATLWKFVQRGCPAGRRVGRLALYDVRKVVAWRMKDLTDRELDLSRERARLAAAQATKTELELRDLGKAMLTVEVVNANWRGFREVAIEIVERIAPRATAHLAERGIVDDGPAAVAVLGDFIGEAVAELHPDPLPAEVRARLNRAEQE